MTPTMHRLTLSASRLYGSHGRNGGGGDGGSGGESSKWWLKQCWQRR